MRIAVRIRLACVAALVVLVGLTFVARRTPRPALARVTPASRTLRTQKVRPYVPPPTKMARLVQEVRRMRAAQAAQARRTARPAALAQAQSRTGSAVLGAPATASRAGKPKPPAARPRQPKSKPVLKPRRGR